ncbi:MAG: chalcone isomerase family protein [Polaromonas sp.]
MPATPRRLTANLLMAAAACALAAGAAQAQTAQGTAQASPANEVSAEVRDALPQARLLGRTRLSVWGFQVYDASLWATAAFAASRYASTPLALELRYLRNFSAADIAARSLKEMRRSQPVSEAQAARWTGEMLRVFPDVRAGDRIMGVLRPGQGAAFWINGKPGGEIRDAEFASLFFGIWLSPKTSEPAMRAALLAGAAE